MHQYYEDIISKLGKPKWWDEHAVPRYCDFSPNEVADIYANEVICFEIACQYCGSKFKVVQSTSGYTYINGTYSTFSFRDPSFDLKYLHYGDPPNSSCCGAGPSMSCDDLKILEFWYKDKSTNYEWERNPEYEIELMDYHLYYE